MRPRDLAKLGRLVLQRGRHLGVQLVPAEWIGASLAPRSRMDDDLDYGCHGWLARRWRWIGAFGNGGQRMTRLPRADVVLVVADGSYDEPDAWRIPVGVLVDAVLPALRG